MKKSLIKTLFIGVVSLLSLAGCSRRESKIFLADQYEYETNYRSLLKNGEGHAGVQYSTDTRKVEVDGKETTQKKYAIKDVRALVIPVDFTDFPIESTVPYGEAGFKEELRKVMFGGEGETDWYSLSGYYASSSYGMCNVTGDIGPTFHTGVSTKQIQKSETSWSQKWAIKIQDYYRAHYDEIDLTQYDANKDGFVDCLIMIYTAPITTTGELWWAFCWSVPNAFGKYNKELEGINRFFWASYNFFYEKGQGNYYTKEEITANSIKPDAHTMTHEFGHVLGLPDYYITDYGSNDYEGLGALDMMDYNIGDHNAMSKALYGWVSPYVATGAGKITLRSFTTTGDFLIIPTQGNYKNTVLDQYIMLELLTPEGVAYKDSQQGYLNGSYPKYYSEVGVRITHVDARLGSFDYNSALGEHKFTGFTGSTNSSGSGNYVSLACTNTASTSCFPTYKLIEVLPATGKSIKYMGTATNEALFKENTTFGGADGLFPNYKMHGLSGEKDVDFGFSIHIGAFGEDADGNKTVEITVKKA
ncbi:MAG: hypothetical protein SO176_04375 [Bacilli bacterium]|nr:hypothetical protein [Bacilli bacterium]